MTGKELIKFIEENGLQESNFLISSNISGGSESKIYPLTEDLISNARISSRWTTILGLTLKNYNSEKNYVILGV